MHGQFSICTQYFSLLSFLHHRYNLFSLFRLQQFLLAWHPVRTHWTHYATPTGGNISTFTIDKNIWTSLLQLQFFNSFSFHVTMMLISVLISSVFSDSLYTLSLLFFPALFPSCLPCSAPCVGRHGSCCRAGWRSLGLVRQTSPSPRAVREVALSTRPPIPLSLMTLLRPLPAGQHCSEPNTACTN